MVLADDDLLDFVEQAFGKRRGVRSQIRSCNSDRSYGMPIGRSEDDRTSVVRTGTCRSPTPHSRSGTAKPMPMNTRCDVGLRMPVTMPTTSPSIVASGPPELPGFAAASNWIRLVSSRLPSGERYSRRSPDTTPSDTDGPMPNGKPTAITRSPGSRSCVERIVAGLQIVGDLLRLQHGEVVLGLRADDRRLGLEAVGEHDADLLRAEHHVQVGQDDALVEHHDAGADAGLDLAVVLGDREVANAHDRSAKLLERLRGRRRQRLRSRACAAPPRRCPSASARAAPAACRCRSSSPSSANAAAEAATSSGRSQREAAAGRSRDGGAAGAAAPELRRFCGRRAPAARWRELLYSGVFLMDRGPGRAASRRAARPTRRRHALESIAYASGAGRGQCAHSRADARSRRSRLQPGVRCPPSIRARPC